MNHPNTISPVRGDVSRRTIEMPPVPDAARPVYNQYRLNQPHDRKAQAVARG